MPEHVALRNADLAPASKSSLVGLCNEYLRWLATMNYSPWTITGRCHYLGRFSEWCYGRGLVSVTEIDAGVLERYLAYLREYRTKRGGKELSPYSVRSFADAVCSLFRWLVKNDHVLHNPAAAVSWPKAPRFLPRNVLTVEETERIINEPDVTTCLGLRDRAMLELLYSSGIRRKELIELAEKSVDLERRILIVIEGKGRKDRYVPITERASRWLEKYIHEARPALVGPDDRGALFITRHRKPFLRPGNISMLVRGYINASGVKKCGACHTFRHTMATLMLENGADVRHIQEVLGHSWIASTQIYTRVSIKKLKEVHALTHPANLDFEEHGPQGEEHGD